MNQEKIQNIIMDFITKSGLHNREVLFELSEDGKTLWCKMYSDDGHLLIYKNGEALASINHIIHKIIEKEIGEGEDPGISVIFDVNNFQKKKVDSLKTIAHMMAERARFFKSSVEVDPMPPFDRRIIHEFLSEIPDIETESTGVGPHRRVVIKYRDTTI